MCGTVVETSNCLSKFSHVFHYSAVFVSLGKKAFTFEISFSGFQESIPQQRMNGLKKLQKSETSGNFLLQYVFSTIRNFYDRENWAAVEFRPVLRIFTLHFSETQLSKSCRESLECLMLGNIGELLDWFFMHKTFCACNFASVQSWQKQTHQRTQNRSKLRNFVG